MLTLDVNWLAVVAGAVANMIIGSIWYGPLFGKLWLSAIGKTKDDLKNPVPAMITSFIMSFIMALGLAMLLRALGIDNLADGAILALLVGIGFVSASHFTSDAFNGIKSVVTILYGLYATISLVVMAIILVLW